MRLFGWYLRRPKPDREIAWNQKWDRGLHLPGIFRSGGAVFDHYSRQCVPIDQKLTHVWYFHSAPAKGRFQRFLHTVKYLAYIRALQDKQFPRQDIRPMVNQRRDAPEMLSPTDAGMVQWRRLVATKHLGGRDAKFWFTGTSVVGNKGLIHALSEAFPADGANAGYGTVRTRNQSKSPS